VIAETIEGAPNIAAIPAATPIIRPQETLPVKKPIPTEIMAKPAKALPALPVTIFIAWHIVSTKTFESALVLTVVEAAASEEVKEIIPGSKVKNKKDKKANFTKKEESFFIVFLSYLKDFLLQVRKKPE
jgi:hypothetical protein